jgi:hypothetical protein
MLRIRKGLAFVPTMAETEAGFYMAIEPVEMVDAADAQAIEAAMVRAVERGNPIVPTPVRGAFPEPVLLRHAGVKSLATFERLAKTWKLSKVGNSFTLAPYRPSEHGGSEEDVERSEVISATTSIVDVVRRLVRRATAESD